MSSNKTILVVEDEQPLRSALQNILTQEGLNVLEARNTLEGLEMIRKQRPDLLLLNIAMPKINSMAMLREVRDNDRGTAIPVILLSDIKDTEYIIKMFESGSFTHNEEENVKLTDEIREGISAFFNARFGKGEHDFMLKSESKMEDIITKIKERLQIQYAQ